MLLVSKKHIALLKKIVSTNRFFLSGYKIFSQLFYVNRKLPYNITIEPTNRCNSLCKYCPRKGYKKNVGDLALPAFKKIIDENFSKRAMHFTLNQLGEPTLNKDLVRYIEYIKTVNRRNRVSITTNGISLTPQISYDIVTAGVDVIRVSINAICPETYRKIRGVDKYEEVLHNTLKLLEIVKNNNAKKHPPEIVIQLVLYNEISKAEHNEFIKFWGNKGGILEVKDPLNWSNIKINNELQSKRYPCYVLWSAPVINFDGSVSLCCMDWNRDYIIGNVKEHTFKAIWNGDEIKKYRTLHLTGEFDKIGICKECNKWLEYPNFFFAFQLNRERNI